MYIHLYKQQTIEGVAQSVTSTNITLESDSSAIDEFYTGWEVLITAGALVNQKRTITEYNGTTKVATVSAWSGFSETYLSQYRLIGILNSGDTTGEQISEETGLNPLTVFGLNASLDQVSEGIKVALRCDSGYETVGDAVISFIGTTLLKWAVSLDNTTWSEYGEGISITDKIKNTNKLFYIRAKSSNDEVPVNDTTVDIKVDTVIGVT